MEYRIYIYTHNRVKKRSFTKKDSRDELLCNDGDVLVQSIAFHSPRGENTSITQRKVITVFWFDVY